ncbi:pectinesterase family protein [Bacillus sonorensis]|uniref:Pectinesterase n=2 Tax=Bacillus sonorensis TaxID=119858 RepID=M5PBN3_9BACI|nr:MULTISPECIES: pectinesterase family protein [Bacillus]TWK79394.1 Pectinesterase A [Bacillus paralicheniformis]ASB90733.1 Pectinesterase [Bacillus sonorensis]EME73130.1 pectinesterase [Bacillus sonorensis L12]MBG9914133.1 carbohydrate esterase [Bacillus sonorensis]MCF7616630.1 pectinesterase family protein [Bacillus sonorensis]
MNNRETAAVRLTVAKDGSGACKTVQEAVDALPEYSRERKEILIKKGIYKEVVRIPATKPFVTLIGESATDTVITYDNYAGKEKEGGGEYGTSGSATVFIYADHFRAENLTFENSFDRTKTDTAGTQAVAVYSKGSRISFKHARFLGRQDTLFVNDGEQYFDNCYIEGDVDFIFGGARAVFDQCRIHSVDRGSATNNGYITAASTHITKRFGFFIVNCTLTSDAADGTVYLGRPWHPGGDPDAIASVLYKNCSMGAHIKSEGWTDMSGFSAADARLYEYRNTGPGAVSHQERRQLSDQEAASWTIENVLDGWNPKIES